MLFFTVSTPRPERPSELADARQSFRPWMEKYRESGVCRHAFARTGRDAVELLDVEGNGALHQILNEWTDIMPAHFDTYPLVDAERARELPASQAAAASKGG
jgi:hypothetical protein